MPKSRNGSQFLSKPKPRHGNSNPKDDKNYPKSKSPSRNNSILLRYNSISFKPIINVSHRIRANYDTASSDSAKEILPKEFNRFQYMDFKP